MTTESTNVEHGGPPVEPPPRPLPEPTSVSAPHWEACRRGSLLVQRCSVCGTYVFPPEPHCTACLSGDLAWIESAGQGTIHSYSVVWRPQQPAFSVPYVVIVVELSEGWHMLSNLRDCDPTEVRVGTPVGVTFEPVDDQIWLPMFRPTDHASASP
jgi:uncharacterized protein